MLEHYQLHLFPHEEGTMCVQGYLQEANIVDDARIPSSCLMTIDSQNCCHLTCIVLLHGDVNSMLSSKWLGRISMGHTMPG